MKNRKKEEAKKNGGFQDRNSERKMRDLPGKKRDPPDERDPLRIFYETLYKHAPDSELAAIWLMECGLLPEDVAKVVYERKQKKKKKKVTPSKSATVKQVTDSSSASLIKKKMRTSVTKSKAKKRKKAESSVDEDADDEFVVSRMAKKQKA